MPSPKKVKQLSKKYDEDFKASKAPAKDIYVPKKVEKAKPIQPYVRSTSAPGHNHM